MPHRVELAPHLDRTDPRPLPAQLADELRRAISSGALQAEDALPATRSLAAQLGVSRGTVVAAFEQLAGEGYLVARQGAPTRVHPDVARLHPAATREPTAPHPPQARALIDLTPGRPDTSGLHGAPWRAAWRSAAAAETVAPSDVALGVPRFRDAIAEHLRTMRGVPAESRELIVTAGAREGLALILTALAHEAGRSLHIGVEQPGYPSLRRVPGQLRHTIVPCAVDAEGLRVDELPRSGLDALIVTPSHQYPLGGSLPLRRRAALLEWAGATNTLIIEDDFDAELRYLGEPLPALTALDHEHTVLLGTFSTLLTPELAAGYLNVPPRIRDALVAQRSALGSPVAQVTQRAIAELLATGFVARHTRRMRALYRQRRELVQQAFTHARTAELAPMPGGTDAVIRTRRPEDEVIERAQARGLNVGRLSEYWGRGAAPGIIIGFAAHAPDALTRILPLLVESAD